MTRTLSITLVSCLCAGCYTGVNRGLEPGVADDGPGRAPATSPDPDGDDGKGDDDGADDDDPAPDEPEPEAPFEIEAEQVELLPFHVRLANLVRVVGIEEDHFAFTELRRQRYLLGDHDYASGIAPDLRWSAQKMQAWVKSLVPVCDSTEFQTRYPTLVDDPTPLVQAAFGRDPTEDELTSLGELGGPSRDQLTCLAVLSSLEFVAK